MVAWLSDWLRNIIAVILLAVMVELLLPNKAMQRYARLVIGLLILLTIMTPIIRLVQTDIGTKLDAGFQLWDERAANSKAKMPTLEEIENRALQLREKQDDEALRLTELALEEAMREQLIQETGAPVRRVDVRLVLAKNGSGQQPAIRSVAVTLREDSRQAQEQDEGSEREAEPVSPVVVHIDPIEWDKDDGGKESDSEEASDANGSLETQVDADGYIRLDGAAVDAIKSVLMKGWGVRYDDISVRKPAAY